MGMVRSTFVLNKQGIIQYALFDIHPRGHAAGMLELVQGL